jgi:hypothetical protein
MVIKLGLNSDGIYAAANFPKIQQLGIKFLMMTVESRLPGAPHYGRRDAVLQELDALASLCDPTDIKIGLLVNPVHGFANEICQIEGRDETELWYSEIAQRYLDTSVTHPSIQYFGWYVLEHYAGQTLNPIDYVDPVARANLTQAQVETAYARLNAMTLARGLTPMHWGIKLYSKPEAWNTIAWFESICGGPMNHFSSGGYPDPNAGYRWTQYAACDWVYDPWLKSDTVRNYARRTPFMIASGMWSDETTEGCLPGSYCYDDTCGQGKGWTYRNTQWYLQAADEVLAEGQYPLEYICFLAKKTIIDGRNPAWEQAILEWQGSIVTQPLTVLTTERDPTGQETPLAGINVEIN